MNTISSALRYLAVVIALAFVTACGGGGGGGDDSDGGDSDSGGGGSTSTPLNVNLSQGAFWEFFWTDERISFAQPNTTNASVDVGRYRVTLGAPVLIQGQEAFPLIITGDTGNGEFAPRWTHVAVGADGSLLGSTDGASLQTIYNANTANWNGGGTFTDFDNNAVDVTDGAFPGVYNTPSALIARREFEDARCEVILGAVLCDDDETQFSETEYYKQGVGPVGYALRIFHSDDGGGFFTSTTINETIELIETSFNASDGSVFNLPPWDEMAPLNTARWNHSAVALNGMIYVLGGFDGDASLDSMEIYDPQTNQWTFGDPMPAATTFKAAVANGRIYLPISLTERWEYNPAATAGNRWTTASPTNGSSVGFEGVASYNDQTFGFGEVIVGANSKPAGAGGINFGGYAPDTNQWLFSMNAALGFAELLRFDVVVAGDAMFLVGGFGRSGFVGDDQGARDNIMEFDIVGDRWVTSGPGRMNRGRDDTAAAALNGKIYIFGGTPVSCGFTSCSRGVPFREVEVYDPATNQSTDLPQMFQPREEAAAVALNGVIYVIGGSDGDDPLDNVDRFTPP